MKHIACKRTVLLVVCGLLVMACPMASAGVGLGMAGVAKNKTKELQKKIIANQNINSATVYNNASFSGAWLIIKPSGPEGYFLSDGAGTIVDMGAFTPLYTDHFGVYSVDPAGNFSGTLYFQSNQSYYLNGQVVSATIITVTGIRSEAGAQPIPQWLRKVINRGACEGTWSGTLDAPNPTQSITASFVVDATGRITSASGLTAPVHGGIYMDGGVFVGRITTGNTGTVGADRGWSEFNFYGSYSGVTASGTLEMGLETNSRDGSTFTLSR